MKNRVTVTTPEYVSLELHTAGIGSRGIAMLIDGMIIGLGLFVYAIIMILFSMLVESMGSPLWTSIVTGVSIVIFIFTPIVYFTLTEAFLSGRTIGKRVMGLRVVTDQGMVPKFSAIFLRNLLRIVDSMPFFYLIGLITVIIQRQEKRLGDLVAGTLVIHHEKPDHGPITFHHPKLEEFQPSSSFASVTVAQWTWITRFLARREELSKEHRQRLAEKMVERLFPNQPFGKGKEEALLETAYLYLSAEFGETTQPS
ncbi:RDD family protein [Marininema halotolerans]|uniref:Uncharacterized membrane protein YckC, RDD family n=1 Tax=Marininema halotolerans TaxID=1155944 RepID=A0A1I6R941_9BACL|nr:RDD family protein [Marininema halotolerans]SFS61233.1 Uncharacterized membrane protein YckC, RDD family [Marininema halotolerans]